MKRRRTRRQSELAKKFTALNRSYDLLWKEQERLRDRHLEVERRLQKLEGLLGVEWQPLRGWFDGEYVPRAPESADGERTGLVRMVKLKDLGRVKT